MLYSKTYNHPSSNTWVVFIHGVGGSSAIWFKQLREYQKHFNLLLIDLRGHGKSQKLPDHVTENVYTFKDIGQDVINIMDELSIHKAHFIGISLGTIITRVIAEYHPDKVLSMILGGAVTQLNIRSSILLWLADQVKSIVPFIWLYSFYAFILMPRRRNRESRMLFIREAKKLSRAEIMRWFKLTSQLSPLLKHLRSHEVPVPTLYIMGEEDYMFLPLVRKTVNHHQFSTLHIIKSCGHVVNVECPEQFNLLSLNFLKTISS
ncbi:alpha/beta hydrolase [Limibacter armeniacum]|uniref:alpha/beta fold hydrolase n=1 Tax=Limibacter armeniacum TaxID=466084 RepID=UPI002FE610F1